MVCLRCEALCVGYERRPVAGPLSFLVEEGNYLCIVGENGAGKSTLMRTLLGLQKPLSGTLSFAKGVRWGYLPQQTVVQKEFPATVREVVRSAFAARAGNIPFLRTPEKRRASEALSLLGIANLEKKSYRELSGGQQRRVLLARALCAAEKDGLLLLDEPVAGLDPQATEDLYALIKERNRAGMTVIMITHDIHFALHDASHALSLGTRPFFGEREAFFSAHNIPTREEER